MKAMVLAAGLGTRLKPITFEVPKPMVPILDRPVMAHILGLIDRQGFDEIVANVHYYPEQIKGYFGDRIQYVYEEELLGTAGGVRNVADFFGDELIVVISGDALTDLDLNSLVARHRETGGIATLTVRKVPDTSQYGVVIHGDDGRIQGFQEKPDPSEALSDLANCGIYCLEREVFDYFPDQDEVDWAEDVFPALLDNDVAFYVHEIEEYWNDIGSLEELRDGTIDLLEGRVELDVTGDRRDDGVTVGDGTDLDAAEQVDPPVWVGANCQIGEGARLTGPLVVGDGCSLGDGASLRDSIVFPGTDVEERELVIGAILGHADVVDRLRPYDELASRSPDG